MDGNLNIPPPSPTPTVLADTQGRTKKYIPIAIGVVLAIVIVFLAFGMLQNVFTRASDVQPRDVVISEITQNSAKVTWSTGIETQGVIEYGSSPTSLTSSAPETSRNKDHSVDLTLLSKNTTYYFQIAIGDKKYDNGGIPWTFTTKDEQKTQVSPITPTEKPATPSPTIAGCVETDCEQIKSKFGKGCTTQDYFKCIKKLTGTPTPTSSPTPTP